MEGRRRPQFADTQICPCMLKGTERNAISQNINKKTAQEKDLTPTPIN